MLCRLAVESLYNGVCTVTVQSSQVNADTGETQCADTELLSDQPCHLSYSTKGAAVSADGYNMITQAITLFIAPEIDIPAGSKITVTQNGRTVDYCRSGEPAVYPSHQEIPLELYEERA